MTTAKFYSPSGHPYSGIGVEPDFPVRQAAKPVDGQLISPAGQPDAMLNAALELARGGPQLLQARTPR